MNRFKKILYVDDGSNVIPKAFHDAVDLAERNQAELTALAVLEPAPLVSVPSGTHKLQQLRIDSRQDSLDQLNELASPRVNFNTKIVQGRPFLEVIREVLRHKRDLVVKSVDTTGGPKDWLFGTTDMHLLRKCPCPVWLIKSTNPAPIQNLMACVDLVQPGTSRAESEEDLNRKILELAGSLAHIERARLHVMHAWRAVSEDVMRSPNADMPEAEVKAYVEKTRLACKSLLDDLLIRAKGWIGERQYAAINVRAHLRKGLAKDVVPSQARELKVDLLVLGTVGRGGIPGLLIGNTAEEILRRVDCSVMAVKPDEFETPVTLE